MRKPRKSNSRPDPNSARHQTRFKEQRSADTPCPVQTYGEMFSTGATIEPIQSVATGLLQLNLWDGNRSTIGQQVEFGGRLFRPPDLSRSIKAMVRFPEKSLNFASTTHLFTRVYEFIVSNGFMPTVALCATYLVFATWFADVLPLAPCLLVTGPPLEAELLLDVLACLVRRPLPTSEFNPHALRCFPMRLAPTLLINAQRFGAAVLELLRATNHHRRFVSCKGEFVDCFCAKAFYCGHFMDPDVSAEGMFHLNLPPANARVPIFDSKHGDEASREFQSKFLAYRNRYILDVQKSQFDPTEFPPETRILARVLGAPLIEAPALQHGLINILREQEEERKAFRWTAVRYVALEAVLHYVHKDPGARVHVGEITETTMDILKGRGDSTVYDAREIGIFLRSFGLKPKRNGKGYAIRFDAARCRDMHLLAHTLGVLTKRSGKCRHCDEI